jgi:DNA-binding response OmpR family regulator
MTDWSRACTLRAPRAFNDPKSRRPRSGRRARCPAARLHVSRFVATRSSRRHTVKALIVEDDQELARLLARLISQEGLTVDVCARGLDAVTQAEGDLYDLVIIDLASSEAERLTACRTIRQAGCHAAILTLTARERRQQCVLALEGGADDCMVKPFEVAEFTARIRALLRRASSFALRRCGDLEVDRASRQAKVAGRGLRLTEREFGLLLYLVDRADQVVKRSDLLIDVWGTGFDPCSNLIDFHVSRLRDKLGDWAWMVETVRGIGYRLRRRPNVL